jgi:hypothetical protein
MVVTPRTGSVTPPYRQTKTAPKPSRQAQNRYYELFEEV